MLIPQKVNVVFDPLSSGIGAGRLELLGIEEKQRLKLVKTILTGAIEFIATTILTAGIGSVFNAIGVTTAVAAEGGNALYYGGRAVFIAGKKFAEATVSSSKFIVSSILIQTTSGVIKGENAEDIAKEVSINAAVITGITFAQSALKVSNILNNLKNVRKIIAANPGLGVEAQILKGNIKYSPAFASAAQQQSSLAKEAADDLIANLIKIDQKINSTVVEKIVGTTIGKQLKGIDSLQTLALSKLKLSTLKKLLKKGVKENTLINKLYQTTTRISNKQKALEKKIIKTIKDKIKPITDIFNIDNVKKQFNNHFDKQTKEYNDLISRSRKDISAIEKLKLSQDMDNFILESQGAMPISGQVGSQWMLGYKWIPNINKNKSAEDQLDATVVEGSLRIFFKSRIPKRARIKHKGKWYYPKTYESSYHL